MPIPEHIANGQVDGVRLCCPSVSTLTPQHLLNPNDKVLVYYIPTSVNIPLPAFLGGSGGPSIRGDVGESVLVDMKIWLVNAPYDSLCLSRGVLKPGSDSLS